MESKKITAIIAALSLIFSSALSLAAQPHSSEIQRNAKFHILINKKLSINDIKVSASNRNLQFTGFVDSKDELNEVANIAKNYNGVKVYHNVIKLPEKSDQKDRQKLEENIYSMLEQAMLPADDVDISVRNNHVVLGGFISKYIAVERLTDVVAQVPGVATISNYVMYKS